MPAAILRAITESGAVWDDPSEDMLFELLTDIESSDETFFIVKRLADASGQTYIQVIQDDQRNWTLERREGGSDQHFEVTLPNLRLAHEAMTAWAFELPPFPAPGEWTRVTL